MCLWVITMSSSSTIIGLFIIFWVIFLTSFMLALLEIIFDFKDKPSQYKVKKFFYFWLRNFVSIVGAVFVIMAPIFAVIHYFG